MTPYDLFQPLAAHLVWSLQLSSRVDVRVESLPNEHFPLLSQWRVIYEVTIIAFLITQDEIVEINHRCLSLMSVQEEYAVLHNGARYIDDFVYATIALDHLHLGSEHLRLGCLIDELHVLDLLRNQRECGRLYLEVLRVSLECYFPTLLSHIFKGEDTCFLCIDFGIPEVNRRSEFNLRLGLESMDRYFKNEIVFAFDDNCIMEVVYLVSFECEYQSE